MEKKPFTPTPEPEMPQYVMSISDRRNRSLDGRFMSADEVQASTETYETEKAVYDEQEAERTRVYENLAALPDDVNPSELTATDIQKIAGISYKQALELQSADGHNFAELLQNARDWKAEQPEETLEPEQDILEDLPDFIKETVVRESKDKEASDERIELTADQMSTVLRKLQAEYSTQIQDGASDEVLDDYRTKIASAEKALQEKQASPRAEPVATHDVPEPAPETTSKPEARDEDITAEQLDRNLRGLISNYRKNKDDLLPEAINESREEIFAAFEQLKAKVGWEGDALAKAQDQLFREMGDTPASDFNPSISKESQAVYDRIDAEAAAGQVEELAALDEETGELLGKQETMDEVIASLGGDRQASQPVASEKPVRAVGEDDELMDKFLRGDTGEYAIPDKPSRLSRFLARFSMRGAGVELPEPQDGQSRRFGRRGQTSNQKRPVVRASNRAAIAAERATDDELAQRRNAKQGKNKTA